MSSGSDAEGVDRNGNGNEPAAADQAATTTNAPEGWYPDSQNPGWRRYWSGTAWTDRREPIGSAQLPGATQAELRPAFCRACGEEIDPRATICPKCGVSQSAVGVAPYRSTPVGARSGGIAIILSLIWPGAGHLYAEDNTPGIVFCVISAVNFLLSWTIIWLIVGIPIWLGTAIWCSIDSNRKVAAWNVAHGFPPV